VLLNDLCLCVRKHAAYSLFYVLQNAILFLVLFLFFINHVLKFEYQILTN
jgi:hypothetical protein